MTADLASIHRAELRAFMELQRLEKASRTVKHWITLTRPWHRETELRSECASLDHEVNEIYTREFLKRIKAQNDALVKR